MFKIMPVEGLGIRKHSGGLLERHAMFFHIAGRLVRVPREHIYVYTLIRQRQSRRGPIWGIDARSEVRIH